MNKILLVLCILCGGLAAQAEQLFSVHGRLPQGHSEDCIIAFSHLYTVAVDPETKIAAWCVYEITPGMFEGRNSLNRNWINGDDENEEAVLLEHQDYAGGPYDIGHLAPLASFSASRWAFELNWMGNLAPQTPNLNRGPWLKIENAARDLATSTGQCKVVVGPLFESEMPPIPGADEAHRVPSHYWAILRTEDLVAAYIVPQSAPRTLEGDGDPLAPYVSSVEEISLRSGLRL